jgi:heptosyltransferase-3
MRRGALAAPANPREVLVIVTRRIGDVLLATPVIRSLKRAWPLAAIDALVFEGTEGVLAANPDLRRTLTVAQRPTIAQHLALIARLTRRYQVALSLVPSDRPTLYAYLAGRWRAGLLLDTPRERWKQHFLQRWVAFDGDVHTVRMHLAVAATLGIAPHFDVLPAWSDADDDAVDRLLATHEPRPFVVLHAYPKYNYKMWREDGWIAAARWLDARGWRIVLTGSDDPAEVAFVSALASRLPAGVLNLAGRLALGPVAALLARARLYVGPDTALTHMAAALGVPTVALYGPTDIVKWGPWPKGFAGSGNPWRRLGDQAVGHVRVLQGRAPCAPCHREGCERNLGSYSDCLLALRPETVVAAIERLTAQP